MAKVCGERWLPILLTVIGMAAVYSPNSHADDSAPVRLSFTLDLRDDVGQNYGTIFEITGADGKAEVGCQRRDTRAHGPAVGELRRDAA